MFNSLRSSTKKPRHRPAREANHFYLSDLHDNKDLVDELKTKLGINKYIKTKNTKQKTLERKFKIAPVPILGENQWGIFTTEEIVLKPHEELFLGEYLGKKKAEKNSNFVFMHGPDNKKNIDALEERNWIPMINTVLSPLTANIKIKSYDDCVDYCLDGGEKGAILPVGTQLLCSYGNEYDLDHPRYIRKTTSWQTASEIVALYPYFSQKESIEADFLALFYIPAGTFFAIPHWHENCGIHPDHMPYIAYSSNTTFVTDNQREDITLLMMACWQGDINRVRRLLQYGADPNAQSLITGQTAFHIVVRSPLDSALKIELIQLLSNPCYARFLLLQDKYEKSILHWAADNGDALLIENLVPKHALWDCVEDLLKYAIAHEKESVVRLLTNYLDNLQQHCNRKYEINNMPEDEDMQLIQQADNMLQTVLTDLEKPKERKKIRDLADALYNKAFDQHTEKCKGYYSETLDINEALSAAKKNIVLAEKARDLYLHIKEINEARCTQNVFINQDLQFTIIFLEARELELVAENKAKEANYSVAIYRMKKAIEKYQYLCQNQHLLSALIDIGALKKTIENWHEERDLFHDEISIYIPILISLKSPEVENHSNTPKKRKIEIMEDEDSKSPEKTQQTTKNRITPILTKMGAIQNKPTNEDADIINSSQNCLLENSTP